ncbi:MAG: hypothetical protein P1U36_02525 [Legionellaceae bacterium]|nr:hypothetical protein [Legionellaceae bacterium]
MKNKNQETKIFLLLLVNKNEYLAYLTKQPSLEKHDLVVCCLSISAVTYCEENKIAFILPEDCFSEGEINHYRALSENKIKDLVNKLNCYFHENIEARDGFKFDIGNYHYFMLYHFFGALHYRAFILSNLIEKHKADKILVGKILLSECTGRPFPVSQYPNNYFELCMNSIYKDKVIALEIVKTDEHSVGAWKVKIRRFLSKIFRTLPFFHEILDARRSNIYINPMSRLLGRFRPEILLVGGPYSWKYVFSDSRFKNQVNVFSKIDEVIIPPQMVKNWFETWFDWNDQFCGFDVASLGMYEMGRIKLLSDKLVAMHPKVVRRVKKYKAIIYTVAPYSSWQYILSVGKYLEIPRICYQHGEMSLRHHAGLWNEASELLYPSHYFSFGEQVSIDKSERAKQVSGFGGAISIGSAVIDKLRGIDDTKEGTYVLYASSKCFDYAGGFVPRYIDHYVTQCQSLLIDYFEKQIDKYPNLSFIWKQNPELLTCQPVKTTKRIKIIKNEKKFIDLLPGAKLVILDRPSTTAIETCMTDKPLFVLLAHKNWYSLAETLFRKRAVIAYTVDELLQAVDRYLTDGYYPADVTNREFLVAYAAHNDDGKSAERAANELFKLMERADV